MSGHLSRRARRSWPQRILIGAGVVLSLLSFTLAGGVGYVYWKTGQFRRAHVALDAAPDQSPRNYLIIGSDSRDSVSSTDPNAGAFLDGDVSGARSDSIMVVRLDPRSDRMSLLSIPRDLYVTIAGSNHVDRINAALATGPQSLIDTIHLNLGIPINNYVEIDFKGFQQLVDAVGGVPMWFNTAVRDDNTGLNIDAPGCYTLTGAEALAFSRSRHLYYRDSDGRWLYDGTSDFGRMARQQLFVRRAMHKVASLDLTSITTVNRLLDIAVDSVTIDQTISRSDLITLARRFQSFTPDTVQSYGVPVTETTTSAGADVLLLQPHDARPTLNVFRGLDPNTIAENDVNIAVIDASNHADNGRAVQQALTSAGFVTASHISTQRSAATSVHYRPGSEPAADLVTRHLTGPVVLTADPKLGPDSISLVVGTDFGQVLPTARPADASPTTTTPAPAPAIPLPTPTPTTISGFDPGAPPPNVTC